MLILNPTYKLQTFFKDSIYIYSFLSVIVYSILFYIVFTPSVYRKLYFLYWKELDLFRHLQFNGALEPIIVLFAWTLFIIITNKSVKNLGSKKIKFCLSYSFFILPIAFFYFYIRSNSSLMDICIWSLGSSVYRFIGVFLFLTVVNVFFECIYILYKKLFQIK